MFSQISFAGMSFAMAMIFGMAISDDAPAVTEQLRPWLDQVETVRDEAHDLAAEWENSARLPVSKVDEFLVELTSFVELTEATSSRIRAIESGNDAACILHGVGLDITARLEALTTALRSDGSTEVQSVLHGIERLLFEGLLIFGREQEARAESSPVIRISTATKSGADNPHPYVEVDCDGNPIPAK